MERQLERPKADDGGRVAIPVEEPKICRIQEGDRPKVEVQCIVVPIMYWLNNLRRIVTAPICDHLFVVSQPIPANTK